MDDAGDGELAAAGAAAERLGGLEHGHPHPLARQGDGGREAVGAGADDDGVAHAATGVSRRQVTSAGTVPSPSSHGRRSTMSSIRTQPSSTNPVAAS